MSTLDIKGKRENYYSYMHVKDEKDSKLRGLLLIF